MRQDCRARIIDKHASTYLSVQHEIGEESCCWEGWQYSCRCAAEQKQRGTQCGVQGSEQPQQLQMKSAQGHQARLHHTNCFTGQRGVLEESHFMVLCRKMLSTKQKAHQTGTQGLCKQRRNKYRPNNTTRHKHKLTYSCYWLPEGTT